MTVFLFAGHTGNRLSQDFDPGAVHGTHVEAALTIELRNMVTALLKKDGFTVVNDNDSDSLKEVLDATNASPEDVLIDLHWNAGPEKATGTEVFVPFRHTTKEKQLATRLSNLISAALQIPNRGFKDESQTARKRLGVMREEGTNILIEVCFITNKRDMANYELNKAKVAEVIKQCISDIANKK